ncbi:MAG: PQQ-like beta-propeller repeat protein [Acidimicrobiia bacterium]|nr:PQQ-like beta-propeller repeat protein [Acidimicrobiia bacterium]
MSQQDIWFASSGDLYRLEVTPDQNELLSVSLTDGETVTLDLQERRVLTVAGTFSGAVMLVFATTEDDNAMVAFDPATGRQLWELPIGETTGRTIAFTNPIRPNVALVASADPETLIGTVEILSTDGTPTGSVVAPADSGGGRLLGWYDETTLLFSDATDNRRIVALSLETGETTTLQLPSLAGLTRLQPLGDGRHLIIQVDGDIARIEASADGEAISLTGGCEIGVLTDFGWS